MSFFAVLLALLIEQLKPLPRSNWVFGALIAWMRWTGLNFNAGRERHAWVVWGVTVILPALAVVRHLLRHRPLQPAAGAGLERAGALPHARLSPVQPLLHRHSRRARRRRRGQGARAAGRVAPSRRERIAAHRAAAPCDRTFAAGRASARVRRVLLVRRCCRRSALARPGAVLYRMAEFASRYWAFKSRTVGVPANDRLMALVAAPVRRDRPCARRG